MVFCSVKTLSVNGRQLQSFNLYVIFKETSTTAVCGFSRGHSIVLVYGFSREGKGPVIEQYPQVV